MRRLIILSLAMLVTGLPASQAAAETAIIAQRNRYIVTSFALLCVLVLLVVSNIPN